MNVRTLDSLRSITHGHMSAAWMRGLACRRLYLHTKVLVKLRTALYRESGPCDAHNKDTAAARRVVYGALQGVTARVRAARLGGDYTHPYDLGLCGNLHAVFGPDASRWCILDRAAAAGAGLSFPTAWDSLDSG